MIIAIMSIHIKIAKPNIIFINTSCYIVLYKKQRNELIECIVQLSYSNACIIFFLILMMDVSVVFYHNT